MNSFSHDDNGAVVAKYDGAGNPIYTLPRNDRGQVRRADGPGFSNRFGYDARGIRVRRNDAEGNHLFHLEGDRLEAVYDLDTGSPEVTYLRGSVIDEVVNGYHYDASGKPTNYTFHHDPVTSVVALTGHAGTLEQSITYLPFGEQFSVSGTPTNTLRFTGRERDPDTGLYYYRARYYDPAIGRFLSEDPAGFGGGDVNLYAYVGNNPLRFNDPSGRFIPVPIGLGLVVGAGAALGAYVGGGGLADVGVAFGAGFVAGATFGFGTSFLASAAVVGGQTATAAGITVAGSALTGGVANSLMQIGQIGLGTREAFDLGEAATATALSGLGATPAATLAAGQARAVALYAGESLDLGNSFIAQAHGLGSGFGVEDVGLGATDFAIGYIAQQATTLVDSFVYPSAPGPQGISDAYAK